MPRGRKIDDYIPEIWDTSRSDITNQHQVDFGDTFESEKADDTPPPQQKKVTFQDEYAIGASLKVELGKMWKEVEMVFHETEWSFGSKTAESGDGSDHEYGGGFDDDDDFRESSNLDVGLLIENLVALRDLTDSIKFTKQENKRLDDGDERTRIRGEARVFVARQLLHLLNDDQWNFLLKQEKDRLCHVAPSYKRKPKRLQTTAERHVALKAIQDLVGDARKNAEKQVQNTFEIQLASWTASNEPRMLPPNGNTRDNDKRTQPAKAEKRKRVLQDDA
ncbi:hypothetical protein HYALB_00003568 [Hymenoscyphus albidus]|uniref:Uncharacterized protein n=1 Tax=Hymenoscyphus albidus TaxID=595503 RepID=A0A9N9M2M4_9HELO|nr:hypothetical protein HYALB_00003568 [Hymenoscyphus albidus]